MALGEREAVDLTSLLSTALEAVDVASAVVMARDPGDLTPKGDRDLTSEVDFAIERAVRDFLRTRTPSVGIWAKRRGCPSDRVNSYGFSIRLAER